MMTREEEQALIQKENEDPVKTRSFRLAESTIEKFQEISNLLDTNQEQTMRALIDTYKSQHDKESLQDPNKLDEFEKYLAVIKNMFLTLIREKEDATVLAKRDVLAQLESKDGIIMDLQAKLEASEEMKKKAEESVKPLQEEINSLNKTIEKDNETLQRQHEEIEKLENEKSSLKNELEETKKSAKETEQLYKTRVDETLKLQKENSALKDSIGPYKDNISKVTTENRVLIEKNKQLSEENISLKKDMDALKDTHTAELQLASSQAELKAKNEYFEQISAKQKELDNLKDKYMALLEKASEKSKKTKSE